MWSVQTCTPLSPEHHAAEDKCKGAGPRLPALCEQGSCLVFCIWLNAGQGAPAGSRCRCFVGTVVGASVSVPRSRTEVGAHLLPSLWLQGEDLIVLSLKEQLLLTLCFAPPVLMGLSR